MRFYSKGLTLIETLLVIAILLALVAIASIGLTPFRNRTTLDTSITTLVSEIRSQQIKAMVGDTEGRDINDPYGIYFNGMTYTLFHGDAYSSSEPTNTIINLGEELTFSQVIFPSSQIVFATKSGEIIGFSAGNNQITVADNITGDQKIITINRYGVISSIE